MKDKQIVNSDYLCMRILFIKSAGFQQLLILNVTPPYSKLNNCSVC